jgi:hypothetical protein
VIGEAETKLELGLHQDFNEATQATITSIKVLKNLNQSL